MQNEFNDEEQYLEVIDFSSLHKMIHTEFIEIKKQIDNFSSKVDICVMNQEILNRFLLPGEKIIKKPLNFPSLPVNNEVQLNCLENFLKDDGNLSAASIYLSKYIDPGSFDNSVRKVLSKIMTNTLAQTYNFQGRGNKRKFEALKTWELVQCALLQSFEGDSLTTAEKVVGSWLSNAKWRQQTDGTTLRQRPSKD
ncbi:uncharacterized protein [Temnothorax nylanderi]|uniref:uncharacterized protein n=1 Tax=Temnothorax nylanderi TaxID=102681 RepID=UPI003A898186